MTGSATAAGEDWADDLNAPDGHPAIAVVFGGAVIALVSILAPAPVILSDPVEQAVALGVSVVAALLVWGVAYAVTIRHAARKWQIGSLLLLWGIALIAAERSLIGTRLQLETDLATVEEIDARPGLMPVARDIERRGPISRLAMAHWRDEDADRQRTEAAFGKLKLHNLAQAYSLEVDDEVLDHCDGTEPAKRLLADYNARRAARGAKLRDGISALWVPEATRANLLDFAERHSGGAQMAEVTRIDTALLNAMHTRCVILARRNWTPQGSYFAVTDEGDLAALNENARSLYPLVQSGAARLSLAARAMRLR